MPDTAGVAAKKYATIDTYFTSDMYIILQLFALGIAFYVLGWIANRIVTQLSSAGRQLGLSVALLSIILGVFTTLPELSIAINALASGIVDVSLGNLLGGIIVLLGFVLGMSALTQRPLTATLPLAGFAPALIYLLLPAIFGLDGRLGRFEGALLLALYIPVAKALIQQQKSTRRRTRRALGQGIKSMGVLFVGAFGLFVVSYAIIHLTLDLASAIALPTLSVGLVVFAIGTNLPEIVIMLQASKTKRSEISLVYLIGSATVNVAVIGLLAILQPIAVAVTMALAGVLFFLTLTVGAFAFFYRTDHTITRLEGAALAGLYFLFAGSQLLVVAW
jgi:cation:H+ antiporter